MSKMRIAVACRNASGCSDMPIFEIAVTRKQVREGEHYDRAETLAGEAGYEGPFVCFDADDQSAILSAIRTLDLVPSVVVVDITGGLVQSVCCDAGEIKVICYDEDDTDGDSESVVEIPVGHGGEIVRCWAHIQTADVDPSLKKARF